MTTDRIVEQAWLPDSNKGSSTVVATLCYKHAMSRGNLLLAFIAFAASCGEKNEDKRETPAADLVAYVRPEAKAAGAVHTKPALLIKAASLSMQKGVPDYLDPLSLDDDGNVRIGTVQIATLGTNGQVRGKSGDIVATFSSDGTLHFEDGGEDIVIAEDGSILQNNGETLSSFGKTVGQEFAYDGPKEARRAMMVAFLTIQVASESRGSWSAAP